MKRTLDPAEAITILAEAPRLVALGIAKGWMRQPEPQDEIDRRRHNGQSGFLEASPDSDQEMVEFRRARNLSQSQAAHLCGVSPGIWHAAERKQRKRLFQLPV